jgi:hypothetical protein
VLRKLRGINAVGTRFTLIALAAAALLIFAVGCGATSEESSNSDPGENASSGNTPHVGPNGSVEVDTLRWKLKTAKTAKTIGDQEYGLGAKANGIYVIATLSVKNNKNESVTLTSETVSLVSGEKVFKPDTKAEIALIGEGGNTFLAEDVGPSVTAHGEVAFDVPPSILKKHPELRFNELGFGETHGYIALPKLKLSS